MDELSRSLDDLEKTMALNSSDLSPPQEEMENQYNILFKKYTDACRLMLHSAPEVVIADTTEEVANQAAQGAIRPHS